MTEPDFAKMRRAMVDGQLRPNTVTEDRVVSAFRTVPREAFVPTEFRPFAYYDEDIEIAPGRFLLEPLTLGRLLDRANIREGERTLVIGGGTGYSAALLAMLGANVVSLDSEDVAPAAAAADYKIQFVTGDLTAGHADGAPYDMILFEGFVQQIPADIVAQVAEGGRIAAVTMDEGAPRAGIGRVFGHRVGWTFFADAYVPALPGFAPRREFTF
ncbi:protein-L-isoaspartate O-methyltransferase family protein [Pacificimonas flava]|uniref:Protein-L-isoaspartate O-methyltransferase n=1 Tax=Pacificimonas flava TaxID=1234595 RepID=M2S9E8_9SPHN|nr:protein-L-isoaspartate O-methyltransferase [Pacificimonas flava]EMD82015.1 Protein-L-isoaspartate O-methyltransferase [Pacificimonas flava]MBB5280422.1 protein-L-isoaspartate(D-aspartate) O-methyltransferase [Pacificimonas flava]